MLDNFLFSLNAVLPIFIVVAIGVLLRRFSSLPREFYEGSEKFVFRIALPCMLFLDVAGASVDTLSQQIPLVLFCVIGVIAACLLLCIFVPIFVKDNGKRGAMIQGMFRSNVAILGVPLAISMFGDECRAAVVALVPFVVITFNVLATVVLCAFAPNDKRMSAKQTVKTVLLGIAKNPLIIGIVLGLPFMFFDIGLPVAAEKVVSGFSDTVTALSLVSIGAGFDFSGVKERVGGATVAAIFKVGVIPLVMLCIAIVMGYRGMFLGLVLVVFGSPTAVSSYIMAKNMGSDHDLAAQILMLSTLFSLGTVFLGLFLLKSLNFL